MSLRGAVLVVGLVLAACTDGALRPGPGRLTATLRSPSGDEGAAVLLLVGEGVTGVDQLGDTEVYAVTSGDETRVVLVNQAGGTLAFAVDVADVGRPLVAVVTEVAGPDDVLRTDLGSYTVEVER
jgi:hypothetical protein